MFGRNPIDDLMYQGQMGCLLIIMVMLVIGFLATVLTKVWPILLVALMVYGGYKLARWYIRQEK